MATYTQEIETDIMLENMTVYKVFRDEAHSSYKIFANEGYVIYDTNDNNIETDINTGEIRPVVYYSLNVGVPKNYNFSNCSWIAVPRDGIEEKYIF